MTKICYECCEEREVGVDFYKTNRTLCKFCIRQRTRNRVKANPEAKRIQDREYYQNNKDKVRITTQKWKKNNPEKVIASRRRNVEATARGNKRYYENNKETISEKTKEYRLKNRDKINAYFAERRKNDPKFKIRGNLSHRIRKVLQGTSKSAGTLELLGCGLEFFLNYLESKFQKGMTWENYGPVWHLDHIIPCTAFDLTQEDQQKICFNYSNLQPLFALDNLTKSNFVNGVRASPTRIKK